MSNPNIRGSSYYRIKIPRVSPARSDEIYVFADTVHNENGSLVLRRANGTVCLALAPGRWDAIYAVTVPDKIPIAIDRWEGEITEAKLG